MGCEAVLDLMNRLTGMFDPNVRKRYWPSSPLLALIRRGTWPDGIGTTISTQVYGRSAPAVSQPHWEPVAIVDGAEGGLCVPQPERVIPGYNNYSYSPSRRRLVTNDICAESIRYNHEVVKQMEAWVSSFGGRIRLEWEMRDVFEYHKNCQYRVVCRSEDGVTIVAGCWWAEGPGAGPHTPLSLDSNASQDASNYYPVNVGHEVPNSQLTWGFLDYFMLDLMRNGANVTALGMENGSPVLTVVCSKETSQSLRLSVQGDLRWGSPSKLLAPFGVMGSLKGYYFLENPYPRRFEFVAAAGPIPGYFSQVPTFIDDPNLTKGNAQIVNPAWKSATYEESFIFDPSVYAQLIPKPFTSAGSGVNFEPVNYTGVYQLMNIKDRNCNPYGNNVFLDAMLADADEPGDFEKGVSFIHLRCNPALAPLACNTPQS